MVRPAMGGGLYPTCRAGSYVEWKQMTMKNGAAGRKTWIEQNGKHGFWNSFLEVFPEREIAAHG
jgi:hypothetical protein